MTSSIKVGSRVAVPTRRGFWRTAVVLKIEDVPRKMTGGRGVSVRYDDGSHGDGWDADDVRLLRERTTVGGYVMINGTPSWRAATRNRKYPTDEPVR